MHAHTGTTNELQPPIAVANTNALTFQEDNFEVHKAIPV